MSTFTEIFRIATSPKIRIATAVGIATLAFAAYQVFTAAADFTKLTTPYFPLATESSRIDSELASKKTAVSDLDSKLAAYWTTITDASVAGKVEIPDSPQAYCQSPPPAASQLESSLTNALCSSLEARAQLTGELSALQMRAHAADEESRQEAISAGLRIANLTGSFLVLFLVYASWDNHRMEERNEQLAHRMEERYRKEFLPLKTSSKL